MTTMNEMQQQRQRPVQDHLPRVEREQRGLMSIANVGVTERVVVGVAGTLVTLASLRGRRTSVLGLVAGGGLLARAATGYCPLYQALGIDHSQEQGEATA